MKKAVAMLFGLMGVCSIFAAGGSDGDRSALEELKAAVPADFALNVETPSAARIVLISQPTMADTWDRIRQLSLRTGHGLGFKRTEPDGKIVEEHFVFYQPEEAVFYLYAIKKEPGRTFFASLTTKTGAQPSWGNRSYTGEDRKSDGVSFSEDCSDGAAPQHGSIQGFQLKCRRDPELVEILENEGKFWADWLKQQENPR